MHHSSLKIQGMRKKQRTDFIEEGDDSGIIGENSNSSSGKSNVFQDLYKLRLYRRNY